MNIENKIKTSGVYCPECNYSNVPIIKKKYKGDDKNENNNV